MTPRPHHRRRIATAAVTALSFAVVSAPATAHARTGWLISDVQAGGDPVLSFSPTGTAALGTSIAGAHGTTKTTEINLAAAGRAFTASPYSLSSQQLGSAKDKLTSLGLSSSGYLAAGFENDSDLAFAAALAPPAPSAFSKLKAIVPAAASTDTRSGTATLQWLPTSRGELVGLGISNAGQVYTPTLAAHGGRLVTAAAPAPLSISDSAAEATDGAGGTFLAGDGYGSGGCTTVAYRPAGGHFSTTYKVPDCNSSSPDSFDAITAGGAGYAAMLTEDLSESGAAASPLSIQVGRDGHFSAPVQLTAVLGPEPVGLASDADGEVTATWIGCQQGSVVGGVLRPTGCGLQGETGTFSSGFGTHVTTLLSSITGASAIHTADRAVALSRCVTGATRSCSVEVDTAKPGGGFRPTVTLAGRARLIAFTSNDHGALLVVWENASGQLFAATGSAADGHFGPRRVLSTRAVVSDSVTAAVSARGEAMVAWSRAGRTFVARSGG